MLFFESFERIGFVELKLIRQLVMGLANKKNKNKGSDIGFSERINSVPRQLLCVAVALAEALLRGASILSFKMKALIPRLKCLELQRLM